MFLTLAIPITLIALLFAFFENRHLNSISPYLFFFTGPILTYVGFINVLTGFDGINSNSVYFGVTFYTVFIAYILSNKRNEIKKNPLNFFISVLNPLYYFTGPIPNKIITKFRILTPKIILKRFIFINSDLFLGVLFAFILAPVFKNFFHLKESVNISDIFLFGIIFELYVYFNFAGFSFIAGAVLRLVGVKVPRNFSQPFGASSIVEYWQRWHNSLSYILKKLFFEKIKFCIGLYSTVFVVFFSSAIWHGISYNFFIWGIFHWIMWCLGHYLHKLKFISLNFIVLVFGITVGRVLFSEIDISFLFTKLKVILHIYNWNFKSNMNFTNMGKIDIINFTLSIILIFLEVILPRLGFKKNDYSHLKSPVISSLIAIYICIIFTNINGTPIYGNR
jgi:alginate O-acetyltransferase complex protein AlgI